MRRLTMAKHHVVIEMIVNVDYGRQKISSFYEPRALEVMEASEIIEEFTDPSLAVFSSNHNNNLTRAARHQLAKGIAHALTEHLLDSWLAVDDTLNGYKKAER
jgi:hypothetical protein